MISPIEIRVGTARRARNTPKPVVVKVTPAECQFILCRIADVTAAAEAIVHHPTWDNHISPWTRQHVVERIAALVKVLRGKPPLLYVISRLDKAIIINAVEANPYFASMADDDPRLTVDAVRAAEAFRARLQAALRLPIRRVPLGAGRDRIH